MIPKIVHFCWLSNDPYPKLISDCISSWKQHLPDYELMLWNTKRIDVNSNIWLKQAYENKKYAFAADYIRFYALFHHGGIYLDADVEVLRSFDALLGRKEFVGEEASGDIEAAVMGTEKGCKWVKQCLDYYQDRPFIKQDGSFDTKPVPLLVSKILSMHPEVKIFPYTYFSPKDYNIKRIDVTPDTYCIHHFDGKWVKKGIVYEIKKFFHKLLYTLFGNSGHHKMVRFIRLFKSLFYVFCSISLYKFLP